MNINDSCLTEEHFEIQGIFDTQEIEGEKGGSVVFTRVEGALFSGWGCLIEKTSNLGPKHLEDNEDRVYG